MRPWKDCGAATHGCRAEIRLGAPTARSCRVPSLGELRGTPDSFASRESDFHTAERFDMPPDRFCQIEPGTPFPRQSCLQDFTRLLLQIRLNRVIEASYGDARHTSRLSLQSRDEIRRVPERVARCRLHRTNYWASSGSCRRART